MIRRFLKPSVLNFLDKKVDDLLKTKINLIGFKVAARLNCASTLLLKQITGENLIRVLKNQTKEPWNYYWVDVLKNGKDPNKWGASLKEIEKLNAPIVADFCFMSMTQNGVYPQVEHYNVIFRLFAKYGLVRIMFEYYDDLSRANEHYKPNDDSLNAFLFAFIQRGEFYFENKHVEFKKKKNTKLIQIMKKL